MSSSADQYASPAYDIPRHSRANSRASLKSEQLPSYHAEQAEEAVDQESVEQKLLEQEKAEKEIGRAALDVDGFRFEIERVIHKLVTVKGELKELVVLYDRVLAVPSSTSPRCATTNKLKGNIDTLRQRITSTFVPLPSILCTLNTRAPHLRGGGGRAFVLTSETEELQQQLAQAAKLTKECIGIIDAGVIRGARLDRMARKTSSSPTEETTCPFHLVKEAYIAEAGETGVFFLDKMIASAPNPQGRSWLNPFAYPLPTWTVTPPAEDGQAEGGQSRPLLQLEEEEEGPWGESTAPKEIVPFSGKRLALILIVFALVVGGVVTGLVLWSQHNYLLDSAGAA